MALVIGNNIVIKINTVDYTQYITDYSESGGDKIINHKKTYGNNYISTITGREDYEVTLNFKFNDTFNMSTLFESNSAITIEITTGTKKVTYNNAYTKGYTMNITKDEIVTLEIIYSVAAANANTYNKGVA